MRLIESCLDKIADLLKISLSNEKKNTIVQFIKFGIVGASNTLISYGLNVLVLFLLSPFHFRWDWVLGNAVAFILSVLWSFYWNNKYVFALEEGEKRNLIKALLKTYVSYGFTGIILNMALSYLWIEVFGISKYITPLINLIISVPLNFLINKFWAFKKG